MLLANVIAMLFQGLSAKLGIVTGKNLAEMCRDHFSRPVVLAMWVVSEIAAMATDLAEFLGGAIGLSLLLHMPLLAGMGVTAAVTYGLLMFEGYGFRPLELIIGAIVGVICVCYLLEMFIAPVDWASAAYHLVTPQIADAEALLLAVGIIGATVMPHAIYLHSGLTQARVPVRTDADRRKSSALLQPGSDHRARRRRPRQHRHGNDGVGRVPRRPSRGRRDRNRLPHADAPLLGAAASGIFLVSLIASGISASTVGTMAGQMIMQGFVGFRIPIWLRRLVTIVPAFVVVALGVNATSALVISQVILSIALPLPMIALLIFTNRRDIMGAFTNNRTTRVAALIGTAVVLSLNVVLIAQTLL